MCINSIKAVVSLAGISGHEIVDLLGLRIKSNGRIDTAAGEKTPEGLYYLLAEVTHQQALRMDAAWEAGYQAP